MSLIELIMTICFTALTAHLTTKKVAAKSHDRNIFNDAVGQFYSIMTEGGSVTVWDSSKINMRLYQFYESHNSMGPTK